ncbi:hypothetical protein D3C79_1099120 [compost metagenome]
MDDIVTGILEKARQPTGELVKHEQRAEEGQPQQQGTHRAAFDEQVRYRRSDLRWALFIDNRHAGPAFTSNAFDHQT